MDFLDYLKSLTQSGADENLNIYDFGAATPEIPLYMTPGYGGELDYDSGFGNIGNFGIPEGSIFEGVVPGGLESVGIPTTPEERAGVDAVVNSDFLSTISKYGKDVVKFFQENPWAGKLLAGGAGAVLGALDKRPPSGGGVAQAYAGPKKQLTRTVEQGKYGPIARFAAQGGIMHAYRNGGQVRPFPMQDGGFVMTKKAVDGAGGPQGLASLVPGARMIRGPGHGTSDSIPAYIQGPNGRTPARVSNGEAYVPPGRNPRQLQAMMKQLERKA